MRHVLSTALAASALAFTASASAEPTSFFGDSSNPDGSDTGRYGSIQSYTLPATSLYIIEATGAPGSGDTGYGAQVSGDFTLTQGETLEIAVGQSPPSGRPGGGGGGTFVIAPGGNPLLVAGGGGSAGNNPNLDPNGQPASLTHDGRAGLGDAGGGAGGANGEGGSGGTGAVGGGGGGGGFLSDGSSGAGNFVQAGGGGNSFAASLIGGAGVVDNNGIFNDGGFGGGGGGGTSGGGGGGGYSGGGGGVDGASGGGGGSFDSGANPFLTINTYGDSGSVVITPLAASVPEPASLALLGSGLLGLVQRRRKTG